MRIGIDGRELASERRGIGRYVFELSRELDRHLPDAEFLVYNRAPVSLPVESDRWIMRVDPSRLGRRLSPLLWLKARAGLICRRDELDVFWGTSAFLPALATNVRTVLTVHDLCHVFTPETFHPLHLMGVRLFFARDVRRADTVLAVSEGTSNRLYEHLGRRADAIVSPAVREGFAPRSDQASEVCRNHYHLVGPYVLTVAAWEPRKNLERLVHAFVKMKERGLLTDHKLVLVGKKGSRFKGLVELLERDAGRHTQPLGYVADEYLPALYAGADCFVLPSAYEGFGVPLLEARACGIPVVTSDTPELREAGGPDAIYIEPTEEGIQAGILTAISETPSLPTRSVLPTWEEGGRVLSRILCP
jgi:glycosyltransferase involved in cell wall biosynthesis